MKILAIDPGYERLGISVIEKNDKKKEILLYSSCFKTSKDIPHHERLKNVALEIQRIIRKFSPDALATEKLFFGKNTKTALKVAETRGVIIGEGSKMGLKIYEIAPVSIKVAVTGSGRADKKSVIKMIPMLIDINKKIELDDEYDAIAIGLTCFATNRFDEFFK